MRVVLIHDDMMGIIPELSSFRARPAPPGLARRKLNHKDVIIHYVSNQPGPTVDRDLMPRAAIQYAK
jgi:hypothetical protein